LKLYIQQRVEDEKFVFYVGPVGHARLGGKKEWLGVSGGLWINCIVSRFEFFPEISPKVSILPETEGDTTGAIEFDFCF